MSLLREIMGEAMGVVTDVLGSPCVLTNTLTLETITLNAIVQIGVEVYENHVFAGIATTAVINKADASPMLSDTLLDTETSLSYTLVGIKEETASKTEFILSAD
uniref:hypothetical protein n=1 Tax=Marinobacterium profundum TaxID=1714300 RepID=UPI0008375124|nr:hypothetical protein [Marinobacterium profundum]